MYTQNTESFIFIVSSTSWLGTWFVIRNETSCTLESVACDGWRLHHIDNRMNTFTTCLAHGEYFRCLIRSYQVPSHRLTVLLLSSFNSTKTTALYSNERKYTSCHIAIFGSLSVLLASDIFSRSPSPTPSLALFLSLFLFLFLFLVLFLSHPLSLQVPMKVSRLMHSQNNSSCLSPPASMHKSQSGDQAQTSMKMSDRWVGKAIAHSSIVATYVPPSHIITVP